MVQSLPGTLKLLNYGTITTPAAMKFPQRLEMLYDDMEIMRVAEKVGYRNYSNFYKAFRKAVGCGPEEFRKKAQEQ